MREVRNDCVDCGLPCVRCSKDYIVYVCDDCGAESTEEDIFSDEAYHYCYTCLLRKHLLDFATDMAEEHGADWIKENFERVGEDE